MLLSDRVSAVADAVVSLLVAFYLCGRVVFPITAARLQPVVREVIAIQEQGEPGNAGGPDAVIPAHPTDYP